MSTRKQPSSSRNRNQIDPNQSEFGIIWNLSSYPFRLRAGDVIRFNERLCRVIRVNECSAVVIMNQRVRAFKTRFDKPVRFEQLQNGFAKLDQSSLPVLPGYLPLEGRTRGSERYIIGPATLERYEGRIGAGMAAFSMGAEAVTADYGSDPEHAARLLHLRRL